MSRLKTTIKSVSKNLDTLRFSEAGNTLYHFIWDDLADQYLEASKNQPNSPLFAYVLATCLKLIHPFTPFVTEAIWQEFTAPKSLLMTERWPNEKITFDSAKAKAFEIEIKQILAEKAIEAKAHQRASLKREISAKLNLIQLSKAKLDNKNFIKNAPEQIVTGERKRLDEAKASLEKLKAELEKLS